MSVHDHRQFRPAPGPPIASTVAPWLRWVGSLVWWVEHAFERARADGRPEEDTRVRIFLVMSVFCLVFGALALGAAHAALLTPKGRMGLGGNPDALVRADLVDRNGVLLASNITHYGLYIDPAQVWDRQQAARVLRRTLPRISARRLNTVLFGQRRALVTQSLTPAERASIHALALGGVSFEPEDRRVYPMGQSAKFIIGQADTGGMGISGAELAFNQEIRDAGAVSRDFALSIDQRVQGVLENELVAAATENGSKGAVGIITDTTTGEVLGMASYPLNGTNHATASVYEMGSVFKTFTIAAAIDTGRADMNTMIDASKAFMVGNRAIKDFHATNRVLSLEEVYLHSSNIGTTQLAIGMGGDTMRDYFTRFGLLSRAPIELQTAMPIRPRDWSNTTLASLSFGYGISITPAQMAAAMGALTNGGRYVPLSLRKGGAPGVEARRVVSEQTSMTMLDLMRRNVVNGSGTRADAPGLRVGGKTGSANKLVNGRYDPSHAVGTFAAVFPTDGPVGTRRYSILILMDEPQTYPRTGGFVAAPAVGRIAARIAPFLGVQRGADQWRNALGEKPPVIEDVEGDGR